MGHASFADFAGVVAAEGIARDNIKRQPPEIGSVPGQIDADHTRRRAGYGGSGMIGQHLQATVAEFGDIAIVERISAIGCRFLAFFAGVVMPSVDINKNGGLLPIGSGCAHLLAGGV